MRQTSCTTQVSLLHSADIQVPMIAGLFRPVLLLPTNLEQEVSREQLRHVFIHELMHLQRGDIVSNWIVALVQALHWFNPVVWYAFFRMRQDRELACDAATLRHLPPADRATYGHTLLQLNDALPRQAVPAVALGMLDSTSYLQRRIHMLVQTSQHQKLQSFFAALLLAPLAAVAFSQPLPASAVAPRVPEASSLATAPRAEPALASPTLPMPAPVSPTLAAPALASPSPALPTLATPALAAPAPASPPLAEPAQVSLAPVDDAFMPAAAESSIVVAAAVTAAQAETATTASVTDIPFVVLQMTEELTTLKADQGRLVQEWDAIAADCEARKDDALFGSFSKSCREVRKMQRTGDVFRFVYACHVLGVQHTAQWNAWREGVVQQKPGMADVEAALVTNEQELRAVCGKETYDTQYPGVAKMLADAAALKYYDPWRNPTLGGRYDSHYYAGNSDPTTAAANVMMSDMAATMATTPQAWDGNINVTPAVSWPGGSPIPAQ